MSVMGKWLHQQVRNVVLGSFRWNTESALWNNILDEVISNIDVLHVCKGNHTVLAEGKSEEKSLKIPNHRVSTLYTVITHSATVTHPLYLTSTLTVLTINNSWPWLPDGDLEVLVAREWRSWHREGEDSLKVFGNGVKASECYLGDSELHVEIGSPLTVWLW